MAFCSTQTCSSGERSVQECRLCNQQFCSNCLDSHEANPNNEVPDAQKMQLFFDTKILRGQLDGLKGKRVLWDHVGPGFRENYPNAWFRNQAAVSEAFLKRRTTWFAQNKFPARLDEWNSKHILEYIQQFNWEAEISLPLIESKITELSGFDLFYDTRDDIKTPDKTSTTWETVLFSLQADWLNYGSFADGLKEFLSNFTPELERSDEDST